MELIGHFYNKGYTLPREKDIRSRGGAGLFYDAMLKIGVIKAERGGRSYGEDLTRGPPDGSRDGNDGHGGQDRVRESVEVAPGESSSHLVGQGGDVYPIVEGIGGANGVYGQNVMTFDQPYMSQEWDAAMWGGWDLSLLSDADVQMEWDGMGTW